MTARSGIGYDAHPLGAERPLVLAGVEIEGAEGGLVGHSDADVVAHAVTDALLGAAGLGDIGEHFPDTDERYRRADSMALLGQVRALLAEQGWTVLHLDSTLVCERPKLGPFRDSMRAALAAAVGLEPLDVSVKFSTNAGMGFAGRGEGLAALAVATIERAA